MKPPPAALGRRAETLWTYGVFQGVLRGDVVQLLDGERRQVQAAAVALLHAPLVVVLLVGWTDKRVSAKNNTAKGAGGLRGNDRLTSDLFDTLEGVFEGVEGAGVALRLALGGEAQLQLFDGLHQLLLGLGPG